MTEDFTTEAFAYLLQELDPIAQLRFEQRLADDPEAAAAVKALADALARYALDESAPAPLTAAAAREMLGATLACTTVPAAAERRPAFARYFWPAAATILLALNVGQWLTRPRAPAGPTTAEIYAEEIAQQKEQDQLNQAEKAGRERGGPRLFTVDLVDNDPVARAGRKGFVYFEPAILKKPGVAPATRGTPASPVIASIAQRSTVTLSFSSPAPVDGHPATAYAWSAFDQGRHQGLLDLYNLPSVPLDCSLRLWVRSVGSSRFENVGEIPVQFYGHSGSVTYKLPSATALPGKIMVTVESRSAPPTAPTGPVVLLGP